ncbi:MULTISPECIES: hypothetical protein [Corallincola]|uniref:Uncharacterized protein n=2 Tax=Corallincola TaxID=1775176 RepID=A0ABY1WNF5_9GAMM|nr:MULTISPECIES: hypothetical protein [Corallincola]TAA44970.1 hypothetical protein EXY25_12200 [Corallincola spongiicola]TCI03770.1 hypothetical protein EZV61_09545 [Corallincola luteus]
MMTLPKVIAFTGLFSMAAMAAEPEIVELESTITGSQEQPKVIYIVPWQQPAGAKEMAQQINSYLDRKPLSLLERPVFLRQLQQFEQLERDQKQKVSPAPQK